MPRFVSNAPLKETIETPSHHFVFISFISCFYRWQVRGHKERTRAALEIQSIHVLQCR